MEKKQYKVGRNFSRSLSLYPILGDVPVTFDGAKNLSARILLSLAIGTQ